MQVREAQGEARELPTGTVTFLFTDIEGSTRLLQRVGPRYREVLEEHARLIRGAVDDWDGIVVNTEGDAFFVVFDRAPAAVGAALGAQRALLGNDWPEGTTVRVRMGLHTGEGALGGDDYVGLDVHRAARIASVAHGGQVLLSAATGSLVEGTLPKGAGLRDLGEHRLADLERPEQILQMVAPGLPVEFPPLQTTEARPHNLPVQATAFVGREREVREVEALLTEARLVTLTGPGGTGKTRLALQVGRRVLEWFGDGVFLVRLEALEDPALVVTTVARALGIVEGGDRPVAEAVGDHLAQRELLLILDNLEHLLEATPQVAELLEAAPNLRVLVTSRAPLRLRGEQEYPVPPLQVPSAEDEETDPDWLVGYEGVDLFVRRAREADPRFSLTADNAPAVAGIVSHLDGLPLALELAAARVKLLPPRELLERLSDRLGLLTAGPTDAPDRHRTLRDAVAWSHGLLEPPEQALFRRLGIFAGSFTLQAAEALAAAPPVADVLEGISALIDASLLGRRVDVEEEVRFQMLETIRAYARERLVEDGEEDDLAAAHTAYLLERAERAAPELILSRQGAWLGRLELDHDDLRAVLARSLEAGDAETGLRLGRALWRFWQLRGHLEEGRDWLERLLELPGASPEARAGLLALAGIVYWQGDVEEAGRLYREALSLCRQLGDVDGAVEALTSLRILALFRRDQEEAGRYLEEASALAGEAEDPSVRSLPFAVTGMSRLLAGDPEGAETVFVEAVEEARRSGGGWGLGQALILRVRAELARKRYDEAEETVREALEIFLEAGDLSSLAQAFDWLGTAAVSRGKPARGVRLAGAAQAVRDRMGVGLTLGVRGLESPRDTAQGELSEEEIERAWQEGLAMELEEALAYAREATTNAARD